MSEQIGSCKWVAYRLPWHLNESLPKKERILVEDHLSSCDSCKKELEETLFMVELADQHLPIELMEDWILGDVDEQAIPKVANEHLKTCEACRHVLASMRESWSLIEAQPQYPNQQAAVPNRFRWTQLPSIIAALLMIALGLGWWSAERRVIQTQALISSIKHPEPVTNLIAKDLFPVEYAVRNDQVVTIEAPEAYQGLALNLHTRFTHTQAPFKLEMRTNQGRILWQSQEVLLQSKGIISLVIPINYLTDSKVRLRLMSFDSQGVEHYDLDLSKP